MIAALYTWQAGTYDVSFGDVLGPTVFPVIVGVPMIDPFRFSGGVPVGAGRLARPATDGTAAGRAGRAGGLHHRARAAGLSARDLRAHRADRHSSSAVRRRKAVLLGAIMAPALWALFDQVLGLPLDFLGDLFA